MSDHSIYYLIKPGDSLESISQKTGIPLNALWNMKSNTFLNVNHLNVGDQIVYKEGVATYENQLYGALSQKPEEPSIFNDPVDRELISRDTINHAALPEDSALPERAQEVEDSSESQSISHNNEGSNSPTKSCEVCSAYECLCEVDIIDNNPNINYLLKGKSALKTECNKRLTNLMLFHKKLDIKYRVRGGCFNGNESKGCVSVYIKEYSDLVPRVYSFIKRSRQSTFFGYYYNQLIEPIVKESDVYHETSQACEQYKNYTKEYEPEKEVLVSIDGNKVTDVIKTTKIADLYAFIRGLNFLIGGNLLLHPSNIYRFGVLTCNKNNKVVTEHYTDFVVLPSYSVAYKGSLSFKREYTGVSKQETGSLSLSFTENINGKVANSIDYTYKKMREDHAKVLSEQSSNKEEETEKGLGSKILDGLFKLGDFAEKYSEKPKVVLDAVDNTFNNKTGFDVNKIIAANKRPKLFTIELLTPKIVFGAEASLRLNENNRLDIDRSREYSEDEQTFADPEKPFCPNGCINTPVVKDIPNRQAYEAKIQKEMDEYKESYLRFDPLIGGVFAINLIQVIGLIPFAPLQALIKGLAFADIDIFSQLSGDELVWDKGEDARQARLEKSNGKALRVQVFLFCSFDLTFSPGLLFHNARPDELGVSLELRGSFGSGFAMGAAGEVDVLIFQLKGATQGSYGIRFYFSLNLLTGLIKIWHDGIGGDLAEQHSIKVDLNSPIDEGWGINIDGVTTDGKGVGVTGSSSTQRITNEWINSAYDPNIDEPFDNPVIEVPMDFDSVLWMKKPVKGATISLPNPVSRYVDKDSLPSEDQLLNGFKGMRGGDQKTQTEYANVINSFYQEEIRKLERQKAKHETGYWFPPTSFAAPSYSFNIYSPPENGSDN